MFDNISVNFDKPVLTKRQYVSHIASLIQGLIYRRAEIKDYVYKKYAKYKR